MTHCLTFDVIGHLDGSLLPTDVNDTAWYKRAGLVKLGIYGTLGPPLFLSSFKTGGTARDVWLRVENQFRNNKEARIIQLDNELRTQEIGDRSIQEYCTKLKSLSDLLSNVDSPVNERTLVMYMLNGLNDKFDNIINVIKHKDPLPSFDTARSMLEGEETRLKKSYRVTAAHTDHSSSSTALTMSDDTKPKQTQPTSQRFNNRGRRFNNRGRGGRHNNPGRSTHNNLASPQFWPNTLPYWPNYYGNWSPYHNGSYRPPASSFTTPQTHQANLMELHSGPHTTELLPDRSAADWFMDSGATSHLTNSPGTLKSLFNHSAEQSVIVGDGSKIPVTCVGTSSIQTHSKPLLLNNV